jgi:hypothetical protein
LGKFNQEEFVMKLASAIIERTLDQFEAEALPDNHPAVPQLSELFGDHTFFLDVDGLNIVEPQSLAGGGADVESSQACQLERRHSDQPHVS